MIKFSEMKYERPNVEELKNSIDSATKDLNEATTYEEAKAAFLRKEEIAKHVETLSNLANIRHDINTKDEFYEQEANFWDESSPLLAQSYMAFTDALLKSKFREDFIKEYGDLMFINAEISAKTFSDEIVEDLQVENKLCSEYVKLIAGAQVPFEGKTYTLSQMQPFQTDFDDERRLSAWKAVGQWYKDNQGELDRIYDELVKVRDGIAKKLGYKTYTELGYYRMGRNCYDENDVAKFREAVRDYLVPVASKVYMMQAERLGKTYPMSYADNALEFRSGNATPKGSADDIIAAGKKFYDELSPETSEFFNTMLEGELMDVLSTEGKAGGGYCTGLFEYGVPFIFANFNGTQGDVNVVTHEAGHAFASYVNRDRIPLDYIWPTMEGCECHSMSMEFFSEGWAEDFFGDDARKYRYSHLASDLTFIPYGTMVDHFQHLVYEKPEMTPRERHDTWKELLGIYQPWMKLDGDIPFYSDGEAWQRQSHIYEVPFYYIDYCLAQTVALAFWAMIQDDQKAAWEKYMAYTTQGGTRTFTELLKNAGLDSPFDKETLRKVCDRAGKFLEEYDLSGIE